MKSLLAVLLVRGCTTAHAQYPQRPIQLIVPWGAGGGTDATARIIGTLLEKELKQPVNVVNRTGGSGVVGHDAIAKAAPDGYTHRPDHGRDHDDASRRASRSSSTPTTRRSAW